MAEAFRAVASLWAKSKAEKSNSLSNGQGRPWMSFAQPLHQGRVRIHYSYLH